MPNNCSMDIGRDDPQALPYWVEMNITGKFQGIAILFYQDGSVSPLKKMTHSPCLFVEVVSISSVQMMENSLEITSWSFEQQMVVIWHQAEAMNVGSVSFGRGFQIAYESLIIFFGLKDRPPLISTRGDVIKCTGIFNSQRPPHDVP